MVDSFYEPLCLAVFLTLTAWQLFVPPITGLSDNNDFPKVLGPAHICKAPFANVNTYFVTGYAAGPDCRWPSGFVSSEILFLDLARLAQRPFTGRYYFDIRASAALHLALLALAFWLTLAITKRSRPLVRFLLPPLAILMFTDVAYVAWLNSAYMDNASWVLFLLLTALAAWRPMPLSFALIALLLIFSKAQHAVLAIPFAAFALVRHAVMQNQRLWDRRSFFSRLSTRAVCGRFRDGFSAVSTGPEAGTQSPSRSLVRQAIAFCGLSTGPDAGTQSPSRGLVRQAIAFRGLSTGPDAGTQSPSRGLVRQAIAFRGLAGRRQPVAWLACAITLLAAAAVMPRLTPPDYRIISLYNLVFHRLAPADPAILTQLGLDSTYQPWVGTQAFAPGTPLPDPDWTRAFIARVSFASIARLYLRHPAIALRELDHELHDSLHSMRPSYMANYRQSDGFPPHSVATRFSLWSNLRMRLFWSFPHFILIPYALPFLAAALCLLRRRPMPALLPLALTLALAGIAEFTVCTLADAIDTHRHLFLFHVITDALLLVLLSWPLSLPNAQPAPEPQHGHTPTLERCDCF